MARSENLVHMGVTLKPRFFENASVLYRGEKNPEIIKQSLRNAVMLMDAWGSGMVETTRSLPGYNDDYSFCTLVDENIRSIFAIEGLTQQEFEMRCLKWKEERLMREKAKERQAKPVLQVA